MKEALARLRAQLGLSGLAAIALLGATATFSIEYVKPLEARRARLEGLLDAAAHAAMAPDLIRVSTFSPAARIEEFYRFFERREHKQEWLAKLYGMATAAGLELRAGAYQLEDSKQRFDRYRLNLPVKGSYAQIRAFLEAALLGIPVLSLDQVSFRRNGVQETRIEAEVMLTLHLLRK